nr:hypothetical protein OG999_01200 [Streptomyces sp. NBC_00886]
MSLPECSPCCGSEASSAARGDGADGASSSGAIRTIAPLAQPHQRASLFASIYLVAYLSFGVPAIIAGLLITPVGLLGTVLGYGVAIVATATLRLLAQYRVNTSR